MYTNMELALSSGSNSQHGPSKASVQSLIRAFDLLEILAAAGGEASLTELAQASHLPAATTHRIMRTLAEGGYVHQGRSRRYSLGPSLIHLGERAGRMLGSRANPHLEALAKQTGETANLAILEGDAVVYIAQAASNHTMRMFTEVGRRFSPHSTGVGKALLSQLHDAEVRALLVRTGTPARTPNTITEPEGVLDAIRITRDRGYAIDDAEQELGVRCVAVPVIGAPTITAVSVSGPASRLTLELSHQIAPALRTVAARIAAVLSTPSAES